MLKNYVKLSDICTKANSNISQKSLLNKDGCYPIYGASGLIKKVNFYQQENEYIAVVKDGAGIGKTMLLPPKSSVIGTLQYILPNSAVDIRFLYYAISYMNLSKYFTGATIPHIYFKDYKNERIPLFSIDRQKYIANNLSMIDNLIDKRKNQLNKFNLIIRSRFIELFGEQNKNPFNWEQGYIRDVLVEAKYGTSRPAVTNGKYPYLRMGNITYEGNLDITDLKRIDVPDNEIEKYMVHKGDVLFNRTNSKELVGKTCVFDLDTPMIIAGYIIRLRTNNKKVLPLYLSYVLNSKYGKQTLYDMCKSIVGQANINAQELQNIKILIPPLKLQDQFSHFVISVNEKSKVEVQKSLDKLETLKKSLMQEYFS